VLVVGEAGVVTGAGAVVVEVLVEDWASAVRGGGAVSHPVRARATTTAAVAGARGRMIGESRSA
jgi:hypothetical protein